jgi:ABC-2 type transport system permease protein
MNRSVAAVRIFVSLKARLLRNSLRGSGGFGLVVFTFVAMTASVVATLTVWQATPDDRAIAGPAIGGMLVLAWTFAPVLFGASDETIDTTRLAMFPLPARQLTIGLAAAGLVGPGPIAAAIPLLGMALLAPSPLAIALSAMAAIATVLTATSTSRWLLTALGAKLRQRRSRDLATLLAGLGAGLFGLTLQYLSRVGDGIGRDELSAVGSVLRYTPFGWSGDAIGRAATGALLIPAVEIIATAGFLAVVLFRWNTTLERALTEVDEGGTSDQLGGSLLTRAGLLGTVDLRLAAVAAKERRYLFRHPRYRVQVVSQGTVLLIGGAPFIGAVAARDPAAVLLGCIPALTAGITGSNLLGSDGRALWAEALALPSLRSILRGRSLAFVAIGLGAATVLTLGVAIWTGGWRFVPVALGAAIGMAFAGAGVGAYTSTLAPTLLPDDNNPNPFASGAPGGGCLNGLATGVGVGVGLVVAAPLLIGLALANGRLWPGILTALLAPPYGVAVWLFTTRAAAQRADRRTPELLLTLSSH